jgi:hypothetical protein
MEIMRASHEWATRPDDQRFISLDELESYVDARTQKAMVELSPTNHLAVKAIHDGSGDPESPVSWDLVLDSPRHEDVRLTNWSFGQLCQNTGAHASYLKKLHPSLSAMCINYGIQKLASRENQLMLLDSKDDFQVMRCQTSPDYGRIWDVDVVRAVQHVNVDGTWQVPAASYAANDPRRATTLYASDRDVFMFLVDPQHPIEIDGENLFRGFYVWNSEVGSQVFGFASFLYRYVCDNRIIWGAKNYRELRIRHTSGGPARFEREGRELLNQYANASVADEVNIIRKAKGLPAARDKDGIIDMLKAQRFTLSQAKEVIKIAEEEEGQAHSIWDIVNGVTAMARRVKHTDARVDLERAAGRLLDRAA